jgi:hypothetical protein
MPREEVRRIGSMGGRASQGGRSRGNAGRGRGFASMPREEVRRIASMGGRASHGGGRRSSRRRSRNRR